MKTYNELKALTGWLLDDPDGAYEYYEPIDLEATSRKVWKSLDRQSLEYFRNNAYSDEKTAWAILDYFSHYEPITKGK